MGNMLTTITSNWFEVRNMMLAEGLVKLNNANKRDEETHMELRVDGKKVKIQMYDNVNWDKYLNHHSIFDLFAMLLPPDTVMTVDEIAYMDGSVAYQHQHHSQNQNAKPETRHQNQSLEPEARSQKPDRKP